MADNHPAAAAFPQSGFGMWAPEGGLTKRELLAAMAMQGLCVGASYPNDQLEVRCAMLANLAVMQADALLTSLAESPKNSSEPKP